MKAIHTTIGALTTKKQPTGEYAVKNEQGEIVAKISKIAGGWFSSLRKEENGTETYRQLGERAKTIEGATKYIAFEIAAKQREEELRRESEARMAASFAATEAEFAAAKEAEEATPKNTMTTKKLQTVGGDYTYTVEGNEYRIYAEDGEYLNTVTKVSATKWETTHSTHKTLGAACDFLNEAYEASNEDDDIYDEADYEDESDEIETEEEREERENREWEEEGESVLFDEKEDMIEAGLGDVVAEYEEGLTQFARFMQARADQLNNVGEEPTPEQAAVRALYAPPALTLADEMIDLAFVGDFADLKEWWDKYSETHDLIRRKDGAKATAVADWGATSGKPVAEITLDNGKSSTPYYHALAKYFTVTRK